MTNQNVIATLHFNKENAKITNNNGKNTYTFTKNGEFTFEFIDSNGHKGKALARVNWIDKEVPKASITYNIMWVTNQDVVAKIQFNKKNVRITNNDGKNTYTFTKNGEFTFEYVDEAGNKGSAVARVSWIKKTPDHNNPNTPSGPGEMEEPNRPSKPGEVIIPDVPSDEKPNVPNVPSDEKPIISNVPSVITNPTITVDSNSNSNLLNNDITSQKQEEKTYNTYKTGIISVKIPTAEIYKNGSLGYKLLKLPDAIKKKLSKGYQSFDVYFETEDDSKVYFENTSIIMTIDVLSIEDLVLYKFTDDGKLIELDYKDIGNHKIEVETTGLGKYILSYKQDREESKDSDGVSNTKKNVHSSSEDNNINMYITILGFVLIGLSILLVHQIRRKREF